MSVLDDIQARIAAITQTFGATSPTGPAAPAGTTLDGTNNATTFGSELESAMASTAYNDITTPGVAAVAGSGSTTNAAFATSVGNTASGSVTGADVVADGRRYLGVPYVYGGTDPNKGLDCSALVQRTYADLGISLPRTSEQQSVLGQAVPSLAQAQPGDLVCFHTPASHIGIYVGDGKMLVAPHTGTVVQIQDITQTPSTIRRIIGTSAAPSFGVQSYANVASASGASGATQFGALFSAAEQRYGLPHGLLQAVAHAESGYNPQAVSSAGAIGLMQLMPATAQALGVDATNPTQAVDGAARLLRGQLDKYGSIPLALAAYNAGGPAVDTYRGVPPYPQTQNYVQKVLSYMNEAA